jgi:chondroitin AC lyase
LLARNDSHLPNDLVGDRFFWRSDYLVHRGKMLFATVKMSSTRVVGGETVNKENLSGAHLADGALLLYQRGHEYLDIFPVWDWRRIPGTTCAQDQQPLTWPKFDPRKASDFVGGACDATGAVTAMDFRSRDGTLRAKKMWLAVGDVVVALGADITSTSKSPVVTTIDQCLQNGEVESHGPGGDAKFSTGSRDGSKPISIEHAAMRFVLPTDEPWSVTAEKRAGNWKSVFDSPATPKADVTKDVFTLSIDHGVSPSSASYAYFVLPASEPFEKRVKILSNTGALQSARVDDTSIGVVFWQAGSLKCDEKTITVDGPCVMMLDLRDGAVHATVADPTQKLKTIRVDLGAGMREIELPQGGNAGSSVSVP